MRKAFLMTVTENDSSWISVVEHGTRQTLYTTQFDQPRKIGPMRVDDSSMRRARSRVAGWCKRHNVELTNKPTT